jgi:membrane fusion protein, multidrug efflux system
MGRNVRRVVVWLSIIAVVLLGSQWFQRSPKARGPLRAAAVPAIPVVGHAAQKGDLPIYLTGLGSVTAYNTVTVRTRVDGELIRVAFDEGQIVQAGDLLAEIDPRPFQVELTQAEGQMERDMAVLENARVDLARYEVLYAQDSIPKQQLDTQVSTVRQFEAAIKADRGPIESAKLQLIYTRITSPITGRIGLRLVDVGNIVHATDQTGLAVITQLQPISVIFSISQDYVPQVMKKLRAGQNMRVEAYDRDLKNRIASGTLETIDNQVDVNTGTVRFKGVFANKDNALFPNQFVNARLLIDVKRGVILVPTAAVQRGPESVFVYVITPDSTVEVRNVSLGPIEGDVASIDKGLSEGDIVVTQGIDKLQPGAKVALRDAGTAR